jgi:hypothetical protein
MLNIILGHITFREVNLMFDLLEILHISMFDPEVARLMTWPVIGFNAYVNEN